MSSYRRCCGGSGGKAQDRLLARLQAVVDLPEGAMIWAAADGRKWRIVDRAGNEPDPPIGSTQNATALLVAEFLRAERGPAGVLISAED